MSGRKLVYGPMTKKQAQSMHMVPKPKSKRKVKATKKQAGTASRGFAPQRKNTSVAAAYAVGQTTRQPKVSRSGVDRTRIIHRELIGSVVGTSAYGVTAANTFSINPGLPASFPWLSTQALGWEKYKFNYLRLCYYTRTGSNTPGSVILTPDYDAADAAPVNEQIASAYHGTQEDVAWKDNCMIFDSRILNNGGSDRFIRTGGLAASQDIKTYDIANVFVGTLDGTAVNWGKIWIEYDVTLINQQLNSSGPSGNGTIVSGGGTVAAATPFGAVPVSTGSYNLTGAATNVLTVSGLSIGVEYCINFNAIGTVITGSSTAITTGGTAVTGFGSNVINSAQTTASTGTTFTATAVTATITLSLTATTITKTLAILNALSPTPSF